jgi:hypothetical protein
MGFTKVGDREQVSEGVTAHGAGLSQTAKSVISFEKSDAAFDDASRCKQLG